MAIECDRPDQDSPDSLETPERFQDEDPMLLAAISSNHIMNHNILRRLETSSIKRQSSTGLHFLSEVRAEEMRLPCLDNDKHVSIVASCQLAHI